MVCSLSVLLTMNAIKEAQKKGLNPPKYQITPKEIVSDYNKIVSYYESEIPYASLDTIKEFKDEVQAFYLIVKDVYLDLDTDEMERIYKCTREKREALIYRINTMESQSEQ